MRVLRGRGGGYRRLEKTATDRVKKVGMGGARGTNGERKNCGRK